MDMTSRPGKHLRELIRRVGSAMVNAGCRQIQVPLCAFVTLLLTHCYSVLAILERKVYVDEDFQRNYRIEDFLWSGSGDGENETETVPNEKPQWGHTTTIFHTTTIISTATIFYRQTTPTISEAPSTSKCTELPNCIIQPTPTLVNVTDPDYSKHSTTDRSHIDKPPDEKYWLITVLKVNATSAQLLTYQLEDQLAKLYKIAFQRHQERHLGLSKKWYNKNNIRSEFRSRRRREHQDTVAVRIHNVTRDDTLRILYSVRVSEQPVLATTAAHDMKFVSDAEAVAELGYPILTKAEPYLKQDFQLTEGGFLKEHEYLLIVISSICAIVIIFLLLMLFLVSFKKRKRSQTMEQKTIRPEIPKRETSRTGVENLGYRHDENRDSTRSTQAIRKENRRSTTRAEENGASHKQAESHLRPASRKPPSPNSFLSMPSVRDFPSGSSLPEPLINLLNNCTSPSSQNRADSPQKLTRHSSIDGEDPGVISPLVWDVHCHRLQKQESIEDEECSSFDSDLDVGKLRNRFNVLLDDALSLYESHSNIHTSSGQQLPKSIVDLRSHSAAPTREPADSSFSFRPKTSLVETRRHSMQWQAPKPRGAWGGSTPSTPARLHSRPLSAGPFHRPIVQPEFILSDAHLPPNDPALPVISAIRRELDKLPSVSRETTPEYS